MIQRGTPTFLLLPPSPHAQVAIVTAAGAAGPPPSALPPPGRESPASKMRRKLSRGAEALLRESWGSGGGGDEAAEDGKGARARARGEVRESGCRACTAHKLSASAWPHTRRHHHRSCEPGRHLSLHVGWVSSQPFLPPISTPLTPRARQPCLGHRPAPPATPLPLLQQQPRTATTLLPNPPAPGGRLFLEGPQRGARAPAGRVGRLCARPQRGSGGPGGPGAAGCAGQGGARRRAGGGAPMAGERDGCGGMWGAIQPRKSNPPPPHDPPAPPAPYPPQVPAKEQLDPIEGFPSLCAATFPTWYRCAGAAPCYCVASRPLFPAVTAFVCRPGCQARWSRHEMEGSPGRGVPLLHHPGASAPCPPLFP